MADKIGIDGTVFVIHDFHENEHRVSRHNERVSAALALSRRHPLRFALQYGGSARSLRKFALAMAYDAGPNVLREQVKNSTPAVKLEAEIQIFERWQNEEIGRIRRENAAIAYAAVEAGIVSPETGMKAVRVSNAHSGSITGRFTNNKPSYKVIDRNGHVCGVGEKPSDYVKTT